MCLVPEPKISHCEHIGCINPTPLLKNGKTYARFCCRSCRSSYNSSIGSTKRKQTCLDRYGVISNLASNDSKKKIQETNLKKYGAPHAMQHQSVKDKLANTKKDRYGDAKYNNRTQSKATWTNRDKDFKKSKKLKTQTTNLEKYGVLHQFQSEGIKDKIAKTNLSRYGSAIASQNMDIINKIKTTQRERFGSHFNQRHISSQTLNKLSDVSWLMNNRNISLTELAEDLGVTYHTVGYAYKKYNVDRPILFQSMPENQLAEYITNLGFDVIRNTRKEIGHEIDIYIPKLKVGIELNGLFWHSEIAGNKTRWYHLDKFQKCRNNGIKLIQIWDLEWLQKTEIVKSRINSMLGLNHKIGARECNIVSLNSAQTKYFFNTTHIQGAGIQTHSIGLEYDGILHYAMSFSRPRYDKHCQWEIIRSASISNSTVVGGASRIFAEFCKTYIPQSVITYSDNRWGSGESYNSLGFSKIRETSPNFWFTHDYRSLHSRIKFQKYRLLNILEIFDENLSAWENMQLNGWDRVWDCGNTVWHWKN